MRIHLSLFAFLLVNTLPSDAGLITRGAKSVARTANTLHVRAAKGSAGLAQDLRKAFIGMYERELAASGGPSKRASCSPSGSSGNSTKGNGKAGPSPTNTGSKFSSPWKLSQNYQGDSFFDGWDFFTAGDPTHGVVDYVDRDTAESANLIELNNAGRIVMRVDTTPKVSGNRRSVRITTQYTYTGGLVLLDAVHMPTGCGTWPAFWSNGPDWPNGGEIDILEGVNDGAVNQATIHTGSGCKIPSPSSLSITGKVVGGTNCAAYESSNAGCGMVSDDRNTYGVGFNNNGGGVYAMQWVDAGISVWFFPRNDIPDDIVAGTPLPDGWGTPMAFWPADNCDPFKFFRSHSAIFDTTLCGDWAGSVWDRAGGPGQEQSCAARVGVGSCEDFVRNHGSAFEEAYWEVNSVKIFEL